MKILFIEDTTTDIDSFNTALNIYNQENAEANIEATNIPSITEFEKLKDNLTEYDAVIVDIKLQSDSGEPDADTDAGNRIVESIENSLSNIPIYIYTGTPENISYQGTFVVNKYTKGEDATYKKVIDHAYKLDCTGLMKIIGGKGKIQELIQRIYKENIIDIVDKWIEHKGAGKNTEELLSRYIASCITAHLESTCEAVKEEMFMIPPVGKNLKTGSILKKNNTEDYFIVLTPECDLILQDNKDKDTATEKKPKANFVLICKLQNDFSQMNEDTKKQLIKYKLPYAYCLPKNLLLDHITFLNFRDILSEPYENVINNYTRIAQILPEFTKEITQKFSTYYSRQGQPNFAEGELSKEHCVKL